MISKPSFDINFRDWQYTAAFSGYSHFAMLAGVGCVRASTLIETEHGKVRIDQLKKGTRVLCLTDAGLELRACEAPFVKGREHLYRIVHSKGEFVAHARHLILCSDGSYQYVEKAFVGMELSSYALCRPNSSSEVYPKSSLEDAERYSSEQRFQCLSECHPITPEVWIDRTFDLPALSCSFSKSTILKIEHLEIKEEYWDMEVPIANNYLAEGSIHHNSGKTYTGSQYSILKFLAHPDKTGFIGANNYNQLSQATLRELFYWLDQYGFEYVIDKIPPRHWGSKKKLKTYRNILSVRVGRHVAHAFVHILSEPDAFRGIEISWYWIDESRDTKQYAHDMILGRLRETNLSEGLVTSTTNGEDWVYQRFVQARKGQHLYGSMHVPTLAAVNAGILTQSYYDTMRATYSPLMAQQELDALHVNVLGGRAYYSAGAWNRKSIAPWGDRYPDPDRPLIVGCDFNFQPSPCVWVVGQLGPNTIGPEGQEWNQHIHWFREISGTQVSTEEMTMMLMNQFPDFFYRIYGDASGNRGTTSNAGETDYNKMANELSEAGAAFTIDVDQNNPLVKNRVENMCALLKNAVGHVRQTYDPAGCPLLDGDFRMVGWKKLTILTRQGRLDTGGDALRTHASDGAGYAVYKLFPPGRRGFLIPTNRSGIRQAMIDEIEGNALAQEDKLVQR